MPEITRIFRIFREDNVLFFRTLFFLDEDLDSFQSYEKNKNGNGYPGPGLGVKIFPWKSTIE